MVNNQHQTNSSEKVKAEEVDAANKIKAMGVASFSPEEFDKLTTLLNILAVRRHWPYKFT